MGPVLYCVLAALLVVPACAAPSANLARTDPRLERVAWLPADTRDLGHFRADQSPILEWIQSSPRPLPPCFATQRATIESHYMVTPQAGGNAANLFHGRLDRAALESCAVAWVEGIGLRVQVRREGALTEFTGVTGSRTFVGWTDDGWAVWHDDRTRVEELLRRRGTLRGNQALERLIGRIDPQQPSWAISISDLSGALLGVPSLGYVMAYPSGVATVVFAEPRLAEQAVQAAQRESTAPRWSEGARQALSRLAPTAAGTEVKVQLLGVLGAPPAVMEELTQAMTQRAAPQGSP